MARLVIADGNDCRGQLLLAALRRRKHSALLSQSGEDALRLIVETRPHAVILDLALTERAGPRVPQFVAAARGAPVIVSGPERQIIPALQAGASGYMPESASVELRSLQMDSVIAPEPGRDIEIGRLFISERTHEVTLDGRQVALRPQEFRLLLYLAHRAGRVVGTLELLDQLWGGDVGPPSLNTVNVHLSTLRRRLGESAARPRYLHRVHGFGVVLKAPRFDRAEQSERPTGPALPDAGPALPDAGPVLPDAASALPHAGPVLPDAGSALPHAGPVFPDTRDSGGTG
ncbi:response regulator transcription factor [Streptomyces sp. NPDC056411]|uniref:response regulator transcription factor n=1 Tax=Streptomyces sp. NPDC056411 TaxID=3345813 RepID=UPI0035D60FE7